MALTQTDKKISQLDDLPSGESLTGFKTVGVKDDANGFPQTYKVDLGFVETAASNANTKAALANTAASNADAKAALVQAKLDTADSDHTRAETDHSTAASDHTTAASDHTQAAQDTATAGTDHTTAVSDHTQAQTDHEAIAPTIAAKHSHSNKAELDLIASGDKAKWNAKYDKPATGIPETDLAQAVKDKLAKEIVYGYLYNGTFYEESSHTTAITPVTNREYVDMTTATAPVPYLYSGSAFVPVGGDTSESEEILGNAIVDLNERVERLNGGHLRTSTGFKKILTLEEFTSTYRPIDNLTTAMKAFALSANQGKALKDLNDANEEILASALVSLSSDRLANSNIAPAYNGYTVYAVGDYCIYSGLLYKCTGATGPTLTFDTTKWTQTTVMAEIVSLTNNA